jgi:predicted HicB family RNase H-like nuclease
MLDHRTGVGTGVGATDWPAAIIHLIFQPSAGFIRKCCQTLFDFCFLGGPEFSKSRKNILRPVGALFAMPDLSFCDQKGGSMSKKRNEALALRVEPELRAAIETAADQERRPMSSLIRNILADWVHARPSSNQSAGAAR